MKPLVASFFATLAATFAIVMASVEANAAPMAPTVLGATVQSDVVEAGHRHRRYYRHYGYRHYGYRHHGYRLYGYRPYGYRSYGYYRPYFVPGFSVHIGPRFRRHGYYYH